MERFDELIEKLDQGREPIYPDFEQKLREMLELQLQEDTLVHKNRNTSYEHIYANGLYFYAILDELGEFIHAKKKEWCWWKQSQKEVDQDEVLEEFSDITHFILSYCLAYTNGNIDECIDYPTVINVKGAGWFEGYVLDLLNCITDSDRYFGPEPFFALQAWIGMIQALGLDFNKDVYEPYVKKNAVNQERMHTGY